MTSSVLRKVFMLATVGLLAGCTLPFGGSSSGNTSNNNTGGNNSNNTPKGPGIAADKVLNTEAWWGGYHFTFGAVTYRPEVKITPGSDYVKEEASLKIEVKIENLGKDTATFYGETTVASNGNQYTRRSPDYKVAAVPGKATSNSVLGWVADDKFNLDDAVLTIGDASTNQAVVPLGSKGTLVALEPRKLSITGAIVIPSDFTMNVTGATVSYDVPEAHNQLDTGVQLITLNFSLTGTGTHTCCLSRDDFSLKVPDGTSVSCTQLDPSGTIPDKGNTKQDEIVEFEIKAPVDGAYDVVVKGDVAGTTGDLPFTITPGGSSSGTGTTTSPLPSGTPATH